VPPDFFGAMVVAPLGWLYNCATLWPENNNHGEILVKSLVEVQYPNIGIPHSIVSRLTKASRKGFDFTALGIPTNVRTKPMMINLLREWFRKKLFGWVPHGAIDEAFSMSVDGENENVIVKKEGKVNDRVMALAFLVLGVKEMQKLTKKQQQEKANDNNRIGIFVKEQIRLASRKKKKFS